MIKLIHLVYIILFFAVSVSKAQDSKSNSIDDLAPGYYQALDLSAETPCNCNNKTPRTYELNKGLMPGDVVRYDLHTYKFTFGSSTIPVAKLFKAFEKDTSVYKISMIEWQSFALLTTNKFDFASFENAALKAFRTFSKMSPEEFLKSKNTTSYNEYVQLMEARKLQEEGLKLQGSGH